MPHYHVIGSAGAGMSAIAHILLDQGHQVSGCDQQANALTRELAERGATMYIGHAAEHLAGVDAVATSSALRAEHPELLAARELGIPVLKRAELWREWSLHTPTLAIAGTHGKTTTTAMCAVILSQLGLDPAYIVPAGGPVPGLDRFARWGSGPFVIEADEYDRLLLGLLPQVAIMTSVDWDHVDIYPTRGDVEQTFAQFARQVRGAVIACADDPGVERVRTLAPTLEADWQLYGFASDATWRAGDVRIEDGWTRFSLRTPDGQALDGRLRVPGSHNVQNATGAIAAVAQFGITPAAALQALEEFRGAARRFEWKGEAGGVTVIDDYAHNPAKVRAVLHAARMRYPDRRLVVYFQPHTFSRTAALIDDFSASFGDADLLLIGDIYPSRERAADFPGIDAVFLAQHVQRPAARPSGDLRQSANELASLLREGDVLLTLGAGDGYQVGEWMLEERRT
ncbi:MAG: UDP-N-acetylmuramate--L-alanine ligase [Chloroflexi bacterium]|nr:UDP-N-acetylmuramate--L-alanine ligase [Chloroflexota bacterium]